MINHGACYNTAPLTDENIIEEEHDSGELKGESGDLRLGMIRDTSASG